MILANKVRLYPTEVQEQNYGNVLALQDLYITERLQDKKKI